jgi:PAS domain S-box-containing protein
MKELPDSQSKHSNHIEELQRKIDEHEVRLEQFERIEETLRGSEERYRSVIDNVDVGIALISPAMEIISLNNQMKRWFPFIDMGDKPICYKAFNNPPRDSVCSYCPTCKTLQDGKVHKAVTSTPSGGKVRHFKIIASPLRDKKGEVVAAIEMVDDITKKKQAANLLKEERKIFFSVLQKAPYGAVIIDRKGKYLYMNEEFTTITGYDLKDVPRGIDWFLEAYPDPEYRKEVLKAWKEDISMKGITRTFTIQCKDGVEKDIEFRSTKLNSDRYLSMLSDITERKKAEAALLKARDELELRVAERTQELVKLNHDLEENITLLKGVNAELETFSYSISHDLKTPTIAVEGFSRILLERYGEKLDTKAKNFLRMIGESTSQMRELIDNLLAYSALGRKKPKFSLVDISRMVGEVFDQLKAVYLGRSMYLSVNPTPTINADKTMIRQVILNLLSNAIKYSRLKAQTDVKFGGWSEPGRVVYYVQDNGVGFPMEHMGRLFDVFERLHPSEEFEGTGIGLATVKRIVQRHGGEVWAQSTVNEGATFYFSIPIVS